MPDARGKLIDKFNRVHKLVDEVAGVIVKAKRRVVVNRFQRPVGSDDVVSDFGRMDFQAKLYPIGRENIEDRLPASGKISIPLSMSAWLVGGKK